MIRFPEIPYKVLFLGRIFLGLVFAYSGFTKLMEPTENFRAAMATYEIIPYAVIPLIAAVIPWIEFIFGCFLIIGYQTRWSALTLAGMSWSFVLLIIVTLIATRSLPVDCGCFGEGSIVHLKPLEVLILDIFNTVVGLRLAFLKEHPFSLDNLIKSP